MAYDAPVVASRWVGVLCLAVTIGWNPVGPPEHAHETEEHGTHHVVVHRHVEGHFGTLPPGHPKIDHGDGALVTLDDVWVTAQGHSYVRPLLASSIVLDEPVVEHTGGGVVDNVERQTHGPPRTPSGLRAPPSASRL